MLDDDAANNAASLLMSLSIFLDPVSLASRYHVAVAVSLSLFLSLSVPAFHCTRYTYTSPISVARTAGTKNMHHTSMHKTHKHSIRSVCTACYRGGAEPPTVLCSCDQRGFFSCRHNTGNASR